MNMTPYEAVKKVFQLPYPADRLQEKQIAVVNDLAPLERAGYYCKVGTGKTSLSAVDALYQLLLGMAEVFFVLVPNGVLVTQWVKWLRQIRPHLKIVSYKGTPTQRKALDLDGAVFIVMSLPIFKKDFAYLKAKLAGRRVGGVGGLVDEATAIKNIESANYRTVREFFHEETLKLMTGTPTNTPLDSYAYIKLIAPTCYTDYKVFESVHMGELDYVSGRPKEWLNLPLLKKNMEINTRRLEKRDVFPGLPVPVYTPIEYELDREHMKLYRKLMEEQILILENSGGKIDATSVTKLWNCAQQIILNWGYFADDPKKVSAGLELIDSQLEPLIEEGKKLIIVANYKMTMATLMRRLAHLNPRLINGTVTPTQQEKAKEDFISDPTCVTLLIHPLSGGKGLDGLQHVCSDMLFIEEPLNPIDFEQPVGRIDRIGQEETPNVRLAVAQGTIQVRLHKQHLHKDDLATFVNGGFQSLRDALYGG